MDNFDLYNSQVEHIKAEINYDILNLNHCALGKKLNEVKFRLREPFAGFMLT